MDSDHYEVCNICENWGSAAEGHADPSFDRDHSFTPDKRRINAAREPFADPGAIFVWTAPAGNRGLSRWGMDGTITPACITPSADRARKCLRPVRHAGLHDWQAPPAIATTHPRYNNAQGA